MSSWTTERIGPEPFIAVDRAGSGPPVFFLHGVGGNRSNWHDQLPAFAEHFTACSWDARGYGDSDDYDGALDVGDFSRDLVRVMEHTRAERAHLVGLSMGGLIAQDFCLRFPDRVLSLTLCDTGPGLAETMSPAQLEQFLATRLAPLRAGKTPADIAPANARSLMSSQGSEALFARLRDSLAAVRRDSYMKALEAVSRYALPGKLEEIAAPTLIVCGKDDGLTPPAVSEMMHRRLPGSQLYLIVDAGHLSNMEQPAMFNSAVLTFLLRLKRAPRAAA